MSRSWLYVCTMKFRRCDREHRGVLGLDATRLVARDRDDVVRDQAGACARPADVHGEQRRRLRKSTRMGLVQPNSMIEAAICARLVVTACGHCAHTGSIGRAANARSGAAGPASKMKVDQTADCTVTWLLPSGGRVTMLAQEFERNENRRLHARATSRSFEVLLCTLG